MCEILYSLRMQITQARVTPNVSPSTPGSPCCDLNPVIRTDCMCSVKFAEADMELQVREA